MVGTRVDSQSSMTHPRGRAGGLAGGAGYFLQSQYIALHLAQLLPSASQLIEVCWERKALDPGGSAAPFDLIVNDVILRHANGDLVLAEVKASAPGVRWTLDALFREGIVTNFWHQYAMLPPELRDRATLRLATAAPAPELNDVVDNARRSRSAAEMLSANASAATEHATAEIGRRLGLEDDMEVLRAFLRTVEVEQLPTSNRLNAWIQQEAPAIDGIDIAAALVNLVDRGKATGPRARSSYTAGTLRRDLEAALGVTVTPGRPRTSAHAVAGALTALRLGSSLEELASTGSLGHRIAAVANDLARAGFDPANQIDSAVIGELRHTFGLSSDTDSGLAAKVAETCRIIEPLAHALPLHTFVDYLDEAQRSPSTRFDRLMPYLPPAMHDVRETLSAEPFVGCVETFTIVDEWLAEAALSPRHGRYVVVHGAAAAGKSAFLCELSARKNWPIFFCRITPTAQQFQDFLLAQVVARGGWDEVPMWIREGPAGIAIPALLGALASQTSPNDQIVLVVDDVDGAAIAGAEHRPLSLPRRLPHGLTVVFSSIHSDHSAFLDPRTTRTVDIGDRSALAEDIAEYTRQRIRGSGLLDDVDIGQFCAELVAVTDGNWLHTKLLLDDLSEGDVAPDSIGNLPTALPSHYTAWWNTWRTTVGPQYWVETALPVLTVLVGALAPLSPAMVSDISAVPLGAVDDLVHVEWARHLTVLNGKVVWLAVIHREILHHADARPFHQGFGDHIRRVHTALADRGRAAAVAAAPDQQQWREYGLRYSVAHYVAAGALGTATEMVLADTPSWSAAHATLDCGNSYVQDLERIWVAQPPAAAEEMSSDQVRLLRIRAAIHDIAQGTSTFLLVPAVRQGLLQRNTLSVLAEVSDGDYAGTLRLFSAPDTAEGRLAALGEVDRLVESNFRDARGGDFLGLVLAYGSDEWREQLFATVNRGLSQGSLSAERATSLIAAATGAWTLIKWTSDFSEVADIVALLPLLPRDICQHVALHLLCQLPVDVVNTDWCREAFGNLVDGDEYDAQLSYLAWSAQHLAQRTHEKSRAKAVLAQIRTARWAEPDESTVASFVTALEGICSGKILKASPNWSFHSFDSEEDGVEETQQNTVAQQLDTLIRQIENFLDREPGLDFDRRRDDGTSPLNSAQLSRLRNINFDLEDPLGRARPTGRLLGALDDTLATWIAQRELEDLDAIEISDPFAVDYALRKSTNSLYLLPWLPEPTALLDQLIAHAARDPAPVSRRTACVPIAGAASADQLRAMVELTTAGLGSQEIDLLALQASSDDVPKGYENSVKASEFVSATVKFIIASQRLVTLDGEPGERRAVNCLRLLDNDIGDDLRERLTRVQAAVMDPLGIHADATLETANDLFELPRSVRRVALHLAQALTPRTAIALLDEFMTVGKSAVAAIIAEALSESPEATAALADRVVPLVTACWKTDRDLRSASRLLLALLPCADQLGQSYREAVDVLVQASDQGTAVDRLIAQGIASATSDRDAPEAMQARLGDIRSLNHEARLTDEVFEFLVVIDYRPIPAWLVDRRFHRPDNLMLSEKVLERADVMADRVAAAELSRCIADIERNRQEAFVDFACAAIPQVVQHIIEIITRRTELNDTISATAQSEATEEHTTPSENDIRMLIQVSNDLGANNLEALIEQSGGGRHSTEGLAVLVAFEAFFGAAVVRAHLSDLIDAEELDVLTSRSRPIRLLVESDDAIAVNEQPIESANHADPNDESDSAALWAEAAEMGLPGLIMGHRHLLSTLVAAHPAAFLQPTSLKLLG